MKYFKKSLFFLMLVLLCVIFTVQISAEGEKGVIIRKNKSGFSLYEDGVEVKQDISLENLLNDFCKDKAVYLDKIEYGDVLHIKNNITLKGVLNTNNGIEIEKNSKVIFDGLNLYLRANATVKIKGGELNLKSGNIESENGSAIRLEYVSTSKYTQEVGTVKSSSGEGTLRVDKGTAILKGGRIENPVGAAISNSSTLYLLGTTSMKSALYDIITTEPVSLKDGTEKFLGSAKIQFLKEFKPGDMTVVLRDADESHKNNIALYGGQGEEEQMTFFQSYNNIDEKNFLCVYKPYEVKYYSFSKYQRSEFFLNGESVPRLQIAETEGYMFKGWYRDESCKVPFDFTEEVREDLKLYAGYNLNSPTFSISDKNFVYDGKTHTVDFKEISHPLDKYAIYSFVWRNENGDIVSRNRSFDIVNVKDSGNYICEISFSTGKYITTLTTPKIKVNIEKANVKVPNIKESEYTGLPQYPKVENSFLYEFSNESFVNAGIYKINFTLTDSENYKWENGDSKSILADFKITVAKNKFIEDFAVENIYIGEVPNFKAYAIFGDVIFVYSKEKDGNYSTEVPSTVGNYFVKAKVSESENYLGIESEPKSFSILEDLPVSLSLEKMPSKTNYIAFSYFDKSGIKLCLTYKSGKIVYLGSEEVSVIYQTAENLRYTDTGVFIQYLDFKVFVPVTVEKANYNIDVELNSQEVIYDGKYHTLNFGKNLFMGLDGIPLEYRIIGGGTDCGVYKVKIVFETASSNYNIPKNVERTLKITPKKVEVKWYNTEFIYNGTIKVPKAIFTDVFGAKRELEVLGGNVNAGENYICKAKNTDKNYILIGDECKYNIAKANYDMREVKWKNITFTYDGKEKTVILQGLPKGVSVKIYRNNKATESGKYFAEAEFDYDTLNYVKPKINGIEWVIEKAEYDLSGFKFFDNSVVYDGKYHYPKLSGTMPKGADGSILNYKFSSGVRDVSGKIAEIEIIFITESNNYKAPNPIKRSVIVNSLGINVNWSNLSFIYDGKIKKPTAYSSLCNIKIKAENTDAGIYTAIAESENPNYKILNDKQTYTIEKATDKIVSELKIEDIFFGRKPNPQIKLYFGEPYFLYFKDEKMTQKVDEPKEVGIYYCVAKTRESKNYKEFNSLPVMFEIKAVLPVSLLVHLNRDTFSAFEKIEKQDVDFFLLFNNGEKRNIGNSTVKVKYQNGESFRFRDSKIEFCYENFKTTLPVKVKKANYDMSKVKWFDTESEYNGIIKHPYINGLPKGVTVNKYTYGEPFKAGEYPLSAVLDYDRENYNEPKIPNGQLIISKQKLKLPEIISLTYSKVYLKPEYKSDLFYVKDMRGFIDVGEYEAELVLFDNNNYEFENGNIVKYKIVPIKATLKILDSKKYLFEGVEDLQFKVDSGTIFKGDDLKITYHTDGNEIDAICENPNYDITFIKGKVINTNRLSPKMAKPLYISVAVFLIAAMLFAITVYRKEAIVSCYKSRIGRAKSENRKAVRKNDFEKLLSVDKEKANSLISDSTAKTLIRKIASAEEIVGKEKVVLTLDEIAKNFAPLSIVSINTLQDKGIIGKEVGKIRIEEGELPLEKALKIYADSYSLTSVKMIALTGGEIYKTIRK